MTEIKIKNINEQKQNRKDPYYISRVSGVSCYKRNCSNITLESTTIHKNNILLNSWILLSFRAIVSEERTWFLSRVLIRTLIKQNLSESQTLRNISALSRCPTCL